MLWDSSAEWPNALCSSDADINFPASNPYNVFFWALGQVILEPAPVPALVFPVVSTVTPLPPGIPVSWEPSPTNWLAVTIPAMTAPPSDILHPIPGILKWLTFVLPKVISLLTEVVDGCEFWPRKVLLFPLAKVSPALYPIAEL